MVVYFLLNFVAVQYVGNVFSTLANFLFLSWYGEIEFFMASFKIFLIIGLILLTFVTMVGGNPRRDAYGFRHWKDGFHEYYTIGSTGRFLAFFIVLRYGAFCTGGPDLVALVSSEIQNP